MDVKEALSLLKAGATGVVEWNKHRSKGDSIPSLEKVDLTKAELSGINFASRPNEIVDLRSAILTETNLQGANLSGSILLAADLQKANLGGARLKKTNLTETNLTGADFGGAVLVGAILARAKVAGANFRDAELQDADLCTMEGFYGDQLSGASVPGAKLPDEIKSFYALETIEKACTDARTVFLATLVGCVYTALTLGTTTDSVLIANSSSTPLPIIGTQIPILGFYIVAPFILFGLYVYFHLCMQNIWERLGTLPAVLPDGRHVDKAADPWLFLGLVQSHFTLLKERTFLSYIQAVVSSLLAWWIVPLTLFLLWVRYLRAHNWIWATEHIVLFVGSVALSVYMYRRAVSALSSARQAPFCSVRQTLRSMRWDGVFITVLLFLLCFVVMYASVQGQIPNWNADFENADVSAKPAAWTGDPKKEDSELRQVKPATMEAANLRNARATGAFLAKADLRRADLTGAAFVRADLRRADLESATLSNANFLGADLRGANLTQADLTMTNLAMADLTTARVTPEQMLQACYDAETKLPELHDFERNKYRRPEACDSLWRRSLIESGEGQWCTHNVVGTCLKWIAHFR